MRLKLPPRRRERVGENAGYETEKLEGNQGIDGLEEARDAAPSGPEATAVTFTLGDRGRIGDQRKRVGQSDAMAWTPEPKRALASASGPHRSGASSASPPARVSSSTSARQRSGPSVLRLLEQAAAAPVANCPCCYEAVPVHRMNAHLDAACPGLVVDVPGRPPSPAAKPDAPDMLAAAPDTERFLPESWGPSPWSPPPAPAECPSPPPLPMQDLPPPGPATEIPVSITSETAGALATADDPHRYYERYLLEMIASVRARHHAVLLPAELHTMDALCTLPADQRRLCVRLYNRKRTWFRVAQLQYQDISDAGAAAAALCANGLLLDETALTSVEDALPLMDATELRALARQLQLPRATVAVKSACEAAILESLRSQRVLAGSPRKQVLKRVLRATGALVAVAPSLRQLLERIELLFFLHGSYVEQTMATLILVGLDRIAYPRYTLTGRGPVFVDRGALEAYEAALRREAQVVELLEALGGSTGVGSRWGAPRGPATEAGWVRRTTDDADTDVDAADDADAPPRRFAAALATAAARAAAYAKCNAVLDDWRAAAKAAWATTAPVAPTHPSYFLRRYTAVWVLTRAAAAAADVLERLHRYSDAVAVYRELLGQDRWLLGSRGTWWDRLALDVDHHLHERAAAVAVCRAGLADDHVRTGHRWALQKRLRRLDGGGPSRPTHAETSIKAYLVSDAVVGVHADFLGPDGLPGSVEAAALAAYAHDPALGGAGWTGLHAENAVTTTLFGLLFWDVLFAPHPDVFQTPYQVAPLDLVTDAFYLTRRPAIDARLAQLDAGEGPALAAAVAAAYRGIRCAGVAWDLFPPATLAALLKCIPPRALAGLCRCMAEDYAHRCGGFPDLVLWSVQERRCKFVEVKGPGDRLSDKQMVWLDTLVRLGVQAEVCHVQAARRFEQPTVPIADGASARRQDAPPAVPLSRVGLGQLEAALEAAALAGAAGAALERPWLVPLVGHTFCCSATTSDLGGRCCTRLCVDGCVDLVREPGNPQDAHAVRVLAAGEPLGHLPRAVAAALAPWLDRGTIAVTGVVASLHGRASAQLALRVTWTALPAASSDS